MQTIIPESLNNELDRFISENIANIATIKAYCDQHFEKYVEHLRNERNQQAWNALFFLSGRITSKMGKYPSDAWILFDTMFYLCPRGLDTPYAPIIKDCADLLRKLVSESTFTESWLRDSRGDDAFKWYKENLCRL